MVIQLLTLASWVIALMTGKKQFRWTSMHTLFALILGAVGLTVITAANNFLAYQIFQGMLGFFVMFVLAVDLVDSPRRLKSLVWMLLLIHAYFAIKGIHTFMTGSFRGVGGYTSGVVGSGSLSDENDFAMMINMMIPFSFFVLTVLKGYSKLISAGLLLLFVMAVVASFSRGGMVGLAAVLLFALFVSKRKLLATGTTVVIVLVMFLFAPSSYWKEAGSISDVHENTANARLEYWQAGIRMFVDNPLAGVGADNGQIQMPKYYQGAGGRDPNTQWGRTFHGTWSQVLAELGLLGGVPYFSMMFLAFRYLFRIRRESLGDQNSTMLFLANSLIGSLIAYIACATFLSTAYYPQLWTTYTLVMILVFCHQSAGKTPPLAQSNESARITGATA
jgi:probable O-glycosylation ligase (exosortase A-associated)